MKAILFDADGMLWVGEGFSKRYQKEYSLNKDEMSDFFSGSFKECKLGKLDLKEELKSYLKQWNWPGTVDQLLQYWFEEENKIDKRIWQEIERLKKKGIKCYLATNQEKYRLDYLKKEMGFEKLFDQVFCSCEIGHTKDSIKFFEVIFEEMKKEDIKEKGEVMFWDDEEKNVRKAREFGFVAELYIGFGDFEEKIIGY